MATNKQTNNQNVQTKNSEQVTNMKAGKSVYTVPTKYKDMPSFSAAVRAMEADGYKRADIARITGARYQHVRNILLNPVKKNQNQNQGQESTSNETENQE